MDLVLHSADELHACLLCRPYGTRYSDDVLHLDEGEFESLLLVIVGFDPGDSLRHFAQLHSQSIFRSSNLE